MYCTNCGHPVPENDLKCPYCGQKLSSPDRMKIFHKSRESPDYKTAYCIRCGSPKKTGSLFCNACGQSFSQFDAVKSNHQDTIDRATENDKSKSILINQKSTVEIFFRNIIIGFLVISIIGIFIFALMVLSGPNDRLVKIGTSEYLLSNETQGYLEIVRESDYETDRSIIIINEPHQNSDDQYKLYKGLEIFFCDNPGLANRTAFLAEGYPTGTILGIQPLVDADPTPSDKIVHYVLDSHLITGYTAYSWKSPHDIPIIGTEYMPLYNISAELYIQMRDNQTGSASPTTEDFWTYSVMARNRNMMGLLAELSEDYENPILFVGGLHLDQQDPTTFNNTKAHLDQLPPHYAYYLQDAENYGIYDYLKESRIGFTFLQAKEDSWQPLMVETWDKEYLSLFRAQQNGDINSYVQVYLEKNPFKEGVTVSQSADAAAVLVLKAEGKSAAPSAGNEKSQKKNKKDPDDDDGKDKTPKKVEDKNKDVQNGDSLTKEDAVDIMKDKTNHNGVYIEDVPTMEEIAKEASGGKEPIFEYHPSKDGKPHFMHYHTADHGPAHGFCGPPLTWQGEISGGVPIP